jgi:hypothetical protein
VEKDGCRRLEVVVLDSGNRVLVIFAILFWRAISGRTLFTLRYFGWSKILSRSRRQKDVHLESNTA